MELPHEIQAKIWDEVRFKMQKDKVVGHLNGLLKNRGERSITYQS